MKTANDKDRLIEDNRFFELPYERFEKQGIDSLSDKDLLACIIRSGTSRFSVMEIVNNLFSLNKIKENGLFGFLLLKRKDLLSVPGIGFIKSVQLLCIFELARRIRSEDSRKKEFLGNSRLVSECYMERMRGLDREKVVAIFLDTKQKRICDKDVSIGTLNMSLVSPREIFKDALEANAAYIVLVHNHPSGDPEPSREDIIITKKIEDVGKLMGIPLLDHVVIGNNCYYSLRDSGYI